jgi:FkbH-like protein
MSVDLNWLPVNDEWKKELASLKSSSGDCWCALQALTKCRMDFLQTAKLDREAQRLYAAGRVQAGDAIRVALLGSSTLKHLVPGIRVAGMRRGLWVEVLEGGYGQYFQELIGDDAESELAQFRPEFVVLALDAEHLLELMQEGVHSAVERAMTCWRQAKRRFSATVIQQTGLPVFEDLFGSNEYRLGDSPQSKLVELNLRLRDTAVQEGVVLLAVDKYVAWGGLDVWHDRGLWYMAQQEVHPVAAPLYGDLLVRLVAAQRGRSAKCLVLDLDNTLWGGVVGDDGVDDIQLSRGNARGSAYLAFQKYCLGLKQRGVLLAVCSKNDDASARAPFAKRSEMVLQVDDFAYFVANWRDKATNLREIAAHLKIGVDALVFVDDNPAERALVRRELPEVAVPELPEDPADYVRCVARGGYFEGLSLTEEDRNRAASYAANRQRVGLLEKATDLRGYLKSLQMTMVAKPFDEAGLQRITQLTNKTNQFNLTTLRLSEADIREMMNDPRMMTWQVSLKDRFGDHGVIALLVGNLEEDGDFELLLWLMSCRVLGRGVEDACMKTVVAEAMQRGAQRIVGSYRATAKNGMVRNLFGDLGFERMESGPNDAERWDLLAASFQWRETEILIQR